MGLARSDAGQQQERNGIASTLHPRSSLTSLSSALALLLVFQASLSVAFLFCSSECEEPCICMDRSPSRSESTAAPTTPATPQLQRQSARMSE